MARKGKNKRKKITKYVNKNKTKSDNSSQIYNHTVDKKPKYGLAAKIASGVVAFGLLAYGTFYYSVTSRYNERLAPFHKASITSLVNKTAPVLNFKTKHALLGYLQNTEQNLDNHLIDFSGYIDNNLESLLEIVRQPDEHTGFIEYDGRFKLSTNITVLDNLKLYAREILSGDVSHGQDLLENMDKYPQFFEFLGDDYKPVVEYSIRVAELYQRSTNKSFSEQGYQIGIEDNTGNIRVLDKKTIKHWNDNAMELIQNLQKTWNMMSPIAFSDEIFSNKNVFARWHNHPLNDPQYSPSPDDEANTYIAGPNVLFSLHNDIFRAYVIKKGHSQLLYEKDVN